MDWLINFMGEFQYQVVEFPNGYNFFVPDMFYILKGFIICICIAYLFKGFFSLMRWN